MVLMEQDMTQRVMVISPVLDHELIWRTKSHVVAILAEAKMNK